MTYNSPYNFHYSLSGEKNNIPVLFLHGFLGSSDDWQDTVSELSNDYYCICPDLPGHGKTGVTGGDSNYSIEKTAEGLISLLNDQKIDKTFLAGYSMGGRLALYMTVYFPERFFGTVLESASPGLKTREKRKQRIKKDSILAEKLETGKFEEFLKRWYNLPLFESLRNCKGFDILYNSRKNNRPAELAKSLRFMGTGIQPSLWRELRNIRNPVLILTGDNDRKFMSIVEKMLEVIPAAQYTNIIGCGHNVHFENNISFIMEVNKFFSGVKEENFG